MKKYLKFMAQEEFPRLRLEDKKMPHTKVDGEANSIKYIHPADDNQSSAARTTEPLISNSIAVYFEATILSANSLSEVGVGLIHKDCALKRHPGQSKMSVGYISRGSVLLNKKKIKQLEPYRSGSVVGIGVVYSKNQVIITHNGNLLTTFNMPYDSQWTKFYPCVSLRSEGDHISLKFQPNEFTFKFNEYLDSAQNQCLAEIERESIEGINMYGLIGDYLRFHGYTSTFETMKELAPFASQSCFNEHPFIEPKIRLYDEVVQMEVEQQMQEGGPNEVIAIDDEELFQEVATRKNSTRQRIMSDYWGDMIPGDSQPKKKSVDAERISRRKISVGDQSQPQRNQNESNQVTASPLIYNEKTTNFLLQDRLDILKLMRSYKIEQAYQKLKTTLPKLFDLYDYLHGYFSIHIYLRILKNEGAAAAIEFMKHNKAEFSKYREESFPVFHNAQRRSHFITFTQLMGLVTLKPGVHHDVLKAEQFEGFANYINQLILKSFGLYTESKLELLVSHIKCIGSKNEQHHINGPLFNCRM